METIRPKDPSRPAAFTRRAFVQAVVTATGLRHLPGNALAADTSDEIPIIDTHIHLFDPTRPQGVPWPKPGDTVIYQPALPERYRKLAAPHGIRGAIEVECSTWLEDNQWVLDVAEKNPIMVGTVGNLDAGTPEFRSHLDRFRRNPLFRGIRYGNLWGRDPAAQLARPEFVADLKALAGAGLSLDTANPTPALIDTVVRMTDRVPNLRIIIDHLPQMNPPEETVASAAYRANLRELGQRPQVYVKVSEVLRRVNGRVPVDLEFYRARLEEIWGVFGEDRVLFGSDWPNSDQWADLPKVINVVREFFKTKGRGAAEKYFWKNSVAAYRWTKRDPSQPALGKS
ncbi:MAG: amidohydrolase family protein [Opitutaceae bacterium]